MPICWLLHHTKMYSENTMQQGQTQPYKANILSKWVSHTFGMTASVSDPTLTEENSFPYHPSTIHFHQVSDVRKDADSCLMHLQFHHCGPKCSEKERKVSQL